MRSTRPCWCLVSGELQSCYCCCCCCGGGGGVVVVQHLCGETPGVFLVVHMIALVMNLRGLLT